MTDHNQAEAMACPISEVLISRLMEIKEMMNDYKQIKAHKPAKGQEAFLKEQAQLYEEQFEACIDDLLSKVEAADQVLEIIAGAPATLTAKDGQMLARQALNSLRE